jgi:hypothetical protein
VDSPAAQVFKQENHLVLLVRRHGAPDRKRTPRALKLLDAFRQKSTRRRTWIPRLQDGGSKEIGNKLKLVEGEAGEEIAGTNPVGRIGAFL